MADDNFSPLTNAWLYLHKNFVNAEYSWSTETGRSLGSASGNIWEVYPFLEPNPFTGLFAGLSIAGLELPSTGVELLEYSSKQGFIPRENATFSGNDWQKFTAEDWLALSNPENCTACEISSPVHNLDLKLKLPSYGNVDTRNWLYTSSQLSSNYTQHCWVFPDTDGNQLSYATITAVTFNSLYETRAPFLRPCYVRGEALLDPVTFLSSSKMLPLFKDTLILVNGDDIALSVSGNETKADVLIARKSKEEQVTNWVQTIINKRPTSDGNIALSSPNCYKFVQFYDQLDTEKNTATLEAGKIYIESICPPCCNCDDYVAAYETLRELSAQLADLIRLYNSQSLIAQDLSQTLEDYVCNKVNPPKPPTPEPDCPPTTVKVTWDGGGDDCDCSAPTGLHIVEILDPFMWNGTAVYTTKFAWDAVSGANSYKVYRRPPDGAWELVTTATGTEASVVLPASGGSQYAIGISAVCGEDCESDLTDGSGGGGGGGCWFPPLTGAENVQRECPWPWELVEPWLSPDHPCHSKLPAGLKLTWDAPSWQRDEQLTYAIYRLQGNDPNAQGGWNIVTDDPGDWILIADNVSGFEYMLPFESPYDYVYGVAVKYFGYDYYYRQQGQQITVPTPAACKYLEFDTTDCYPPLAKVTMTYAHSESERREFGYECVLLSWTAMQGAMSYRVYYSWIAGSGEYMYYDSTNATSAAMHIEPWETLHGYRVTVMYAGGVESVPTTATW
jgi:hypothetical protein